jgi:hypothetical protein
MPLAKYPTIYSGIFAVAAGHWRIESELDCCKAIRANGPKKGSLFAFIVGLDYAANI